MAEICDLPLKMRQHAIHEQNREARDRLWERLKPQCVRQLINGEPLVRHGRIVINFRDVLAQAWPELISKADSLEDADDILREAAEDVADYFANQFIDAAREEAEQLAAEEALS